MKYGHVGRPTNEEVKQRKRKKIIKIAIPITIVIVILLIFADKLGLKSLMGNSVAVYEYVCPGGWKYNHHNNKCVYKSYVDVSLLGDTDQNTKIQYRDYILLKQAVYTNKTLDSTEKAIYDINNDNKVDENDIVDFVNLMGIKNTSDTVSNKKKTYKYICPKDSNVDGVKTIYKKVNKKQCSLTIEMDATKIERVYDASDLAEAYKIGDEVELNNELYYVIADSSRFQDYVTLLKAEPLKIDEVNLYGTGHINRYTSNSRGKAYNHNGYGIVAYYSNIKCGYSSNPNNEQCINEYAKSDIKYIVDNWAMSKFRKDLLKEVDGYKARLINYNEFLNIEEYSWKYSPNYNYWSSNAVNDYVKGAWQVTSTGYWSAQNVNDNIVNTLNGIEYMALRPVINVNKSEIMKAYKIGDEVDIKGEKYYTIADSPKENDYVTLLKAEPLKTVEVNKYGAGHINRYTTKSRNQAYDYNGYGAVAFYTSPTCNDYPKNNKKNCINDYNKSDVKYIVDNWANDNFNNNDLKLVDGYKARLIIEKEFAEIFSYSFRSNVNYNYWSMVPSNNNSYEVFQINSDGYWGTRGVNENIIHTSYNDEYMTVRPVINIKKSSI